MMRIIPPRACVARVGGVTRNWKNLHRVRRDFWWGPCLWAEEQSQCPLCSLAEMREIKTLTSGVDSCFPAGLLFPGVKWFTRSHCRAEFQGHRYCRAGQRRAPTGKITSTDRKENTRQSAEVGRELSMERWKNKVSRKNSKYNGLREMAGLLNKIRIWMWKKICEGNQMMKENSRGD